MSWKDNGRGMNSLAITKCLQEIALGRASPTRRDYALDIYYKNICNNRKMTSPDENPSLPTSGQTAAELEHEVISFWVQVAVFLGFSRSTGEIFGLIFVSEAPLSADDVVGRLGMSRSGAGQGLKTLQDIGAIKPAHQMASRKEHYQMQTDLGVLIKLLLNGRLLPKLEELSQQHAALDAAARAQGAAHLVQRFDKLERWRGKTAPLLALIKGFAS